MAVPLTHHGRPPPGSCLLTGLHCLPLQVRSIVGTLLEVLTTPSESVQRGVSDCLPALMQASAVLPQHVLPVVPELSLLFCLRTVCHCACWLQCVGPAAACKAVLHQRPSLPVPMPSHHTTSLAQALQGDSTFVESTVQTLLQRCLKGAKYGDRWAHISDLFLLHG